jgi:proline dehydrogenase
VSIGKDSVPLSYSGCFRGSDEFQTLYGVRPNLPDEIVRGGHRMRIYVPFGQQWYPYSMRRFQENPQIPGMFSGLCSLIK